MFYRQLKYQHGHLQHVAHSYKKFTQNITMKCILKYLKNVTT